MKKQFKKCPRCKDLKLTTEFYKNEAYSNGLDSWCIDCRKEVYKNYSKTDDGKKSHAKKMSKYRVKRNAEFKAKYGYTYDNIMQMARKSNPVLEPCELCYSTKGVQRHHDNYNDPEDVRFLCRKHHKEAHDD